jgi:hypothetical protein
MRGCFLQQNQSAGGPAPIRTPARATDPLGTDQFLVMRDFLEICRSAELVR